MKITYELGEILSDKYFDEVIKKLYTNSELSAEEKAYILGCAVILLQEYDATNEKIYFEVAYDIILKYSLSYNDYRPLYDVSCNYGFYPTVRFINEKRELRDASITDVINDYKLEYYKNESYIETYEQHKARNGVINSQMSNVCFIAPTSSGKSSVIIQHIKRNAWVKKAIILVPTKSLIAQTYGELRKSSLNRKIISHEAMYQGEEQFVGVLTQERALRLLEKNIDLDIDCIYVDEAHNIFTNDARNVLLSRVIRICRNRKRDAKIIYLSPFVEDAKHLLQGEETEIDEQRISFNIKEPLIKEYRKEGEVFVYNRFSNQFTWTGDTYDNAFDYMFNNDKSKNFCFLGSPKKIEQFAEELYERTSDIPHSEDLDELISILSENVHPEFAMNKYLKHGIIYLHAKLPEQIKEYLEYQFKTNPKIKYLIANSVVLEGINMPIDSLFIWDVNNMNNAKIQNLIGRVNRLNNVFDLKNEGLEGLIPHVHFINSDYYYKSKRRMKKCIEKLYDDKQDDITNPLLDSFDIEKVKEKERKKVQKENKEIISQEQLYFSVPNTERDQLKRQLISSGMNQLLYLTNDNVDIIAKELASVDNAKSIVEIVSDVFTKNDMAKDKAFSRLQNRKAINYYQHFISASHKGNLATLVNSELHYQRERNANGDYLMYVGTSYGEVAAYNNEKSGKVFIDVSKKSNYELVNYLIVKIKVEQEFLGFQYNRAVNFLHDYGVIDDERYNLEIYGTNDSKKIQMLNMGIPIGILSLLETNNQLSNIFVDANGNIKGNDRLKAFVNKQNSFWKYEILKHIFF